MNKKQKFKKEYIIKKLESNGFFNYLINKEIKWGYSWKYKTDSFLDNIKHYQEFLYEDANFDSHWTFLFLRLKLEGLYEGCVINGVTLDSTKQKYQRKLKQAIFLSKRLYEDDYYFQNHARDTEKNFRTRYFNDGKKNWFLCDKKQDDVDYLFKIIAKNIQKWWD